MYPVASSFIPITVALARFIEIHGFGGNYPFWYLGSTPTKYLIGPLAPYLLIGFHKLLPFLNLFDISLILILLSFGGSALGWGMLTFQLSKDKKLAILAGLLILILPWHVVWDLAFGEVSAVLAASLTPWVLLAFAKLQITNYKLQIIVPAAAFALLLLTNSTAAIPAMVGLLILGFLKNKKWDKGLKQAGLVIILGWVVSSFWYGPNYWFTVWGAPSFGGRNVISTFVWVIELLRGFIPVLIAVWVLVFKLKKQSLLGKFIYLWLGSFGLLTLFRFMANVHFWLDWTVWLPQVEVGVALLFAIKLHPRFKQKIIRFSVPFAIFLIYIVGGWVLAMSKHEYWMPSRSIEGRVEYQIAKELSKTVKTNETVFLSGTTAFWLNSLVDARQVRGGRDEASQDPAWRQVEWEVRSGSNLGTAYPLLKSAGVDFIVVHTQSSKEFYHDFQFPLKFENSLNFEKIYESDGDIIYKIH